MKSAKQISSAFVVALALASPVHAQDYPTRSINVVVPFPAGGPSDVVARIVTEHMGRTLGQSVIVENIAGAGGTTGASRVARAAPDGYTLLMGNLGTQAASVGLYPKLSYDPRTDFEPVMNSASSEAR